MFFQGAGLNPSTRGSHGAASAQRQQKPFKLKNALKSKRFKQKPSTCSRFVAQNGCEASHKFSKDKGSSEDLRITSSNETVEAIVTAQLAFHECSESSSFEPRLHLDFDKVKFFTANILDPQQ